MKRRNTGILTPAEAASMLGVHPATLARWVDEGHLRAFRTPGGHRRIPRGEVERLLKEGGG